MEKSNFKTQPKYTYDLILADPPWKYSFSHSSTRKIENHYPTMTVSEIKALGPKLPVTDNALLYLWATAPKLLEALAVMEAWGFTYKTHGIWDKEIIGMGYWFRGQHEIILVGTKGKYSPPEPKFRISSILREKRSRHSSKPVSFHIWIEKAFPDAKKLELFARERRQNWDIWGDEVKSDITLT
jgi:N6-adenosine-specific RNA methylase IME4